MLDLVYPSTSAPLYPRPSADRPGRRTRPVNGEMLPLVQPNGLVYGQASRAWCHSGSHALHPVVHLHILDRFGRIYLQKRAVTKDLYPGYWDTAVGGHITYGEQVLEALYREAAEELGLQAFNPQDLGNYIYETPRDSEFVFIFAMVGHPELSPDNAEVSEGKWWTFEELDKAMGKRILTPNFESEFARIRAQLLSLL